MSSPVPIFGSQDLHDDDGQVIDSFFKEVDAPPDIKGAVQPIPNPPLPPVIPRPTTLIPGTEIIVPGQPAYQLLPADVNRIEMELFVTTPAAATATDYVNVGGEQGAVSAASQVTTPVRGSTRVRPSTTGWDFDAYTGPIYIAGSAGQTQNLEVSWRAVTK